LSAITTSLLITLSLTFITTSPAQAQNNNYSFTIELQGENSSLVVDYSIQLLDMRDRTIIATAFGDTLGGFAFRGVSAGRYIARVMDGNAFVVREETITLDGVSPSIQLGAPEPQRKSAGGGTVSMQQLMNPPSKAAIKAFTQSQKYSTAGNYQEAAVALEKAIKLSPKFAEAHTNLAAQYLRLGKFEMAREQAKLAMEISGPNTKDLTNLAAASWAVGQAVDALNFARAAVRLDQRALGAQYIMGSILVLSPKTLREGMRHLELAAEKFPSAAQKLATYRQTVAGMQ
jgi:tetratricopeptide (TPR) repeat protein